LRHFVERLDFADKAARLSTESIRRKGIEVSPPSPLPAKSAATIHSTTTPISVDHCRNRDPPRPVSPVWGKFPVFPVEPGISSILPAQPPFASKDGEANQTLASEFP